MDRRFGKSPSWLGETSGTSTVYMQVYAEQDQEPQQDRKERRGERPKESQRKVVVFPGDDNANDKVNQPKKGKNS